jgi:DNA polymerase
MIDFNSETIYAQNSLNELQDMCQNCTLCNLHKTRQKVVFGSGPIPCNLMVIGEGPGEQEDLQGIPFVGKAGDLLTKIFEAVNIKRESEIFITNIVKCRPPKNRNPEQKEILACQSYLIRQLQLIKPKILIILGSPALKALINNKLSITKARGNWLKAQVDYMSDYLYIMPTFHPSYLLRKESKEKGSPKWLAWQDMKEVKAALDFYSSSNYNA